MSPSGSDAAQTASGVTDSPVVLEKRHDGWVELILNRPAKRNSLSAELLTELQRLLLAADADLDVHAVLISGSRESPDFCTGYYQEGLHVGLAPGEDTLEGDAMRMGAKQRQLQTIFDMHKPVVVMVHGRCLAGGTDLAGMSDMVIAAEDSRFGFPPHRDFGHSPSNQWLYRCGPQWTKRLLFTGDQISAPDAARIGLILKAVPLQHLEREVHGLMARMAHIDPALLAVHKRAVNLGLELMGARTFQRLSLELDVRAHNAPAVLEVKAFSQGPDGKEFNARLKRERAEKFGTGLISVTEPDPYAEDGRLD